jgi:DNA invertase Pin-like site-specific DNA recombinase
MTVGVLALVAQHEAEAISKHTKDALAARRTRGAAVRTPRDVSSYQKRASRLGAATNRAIAEKWALLIAPAIAQARAEGCASLRQIAGYLNAQMIFTPRSKQWTATAIAHAIAYAPVCLTA